jgi:hypothetical protein
VYRYALLRRSSLYANLDRGWPYTLELRDGSSVALEVSELVDLMTLDFANRLEQTHGPLDDDDLLTYAKAVPLLPALAVRAFRELRDRPVPMKQRAHKLARRVPGLRTVKRRLQH